MEGMVVVYKSTKFDNGGDGVVALNVDKTRRIRRFPNAISSENHVV